jgi:YidC/Oxa1 family membrane protein insertase
MFDFIFNILGELLRWIYSFSNNFGVAVIIFTVLIRVVLLPLTIKQQKSMAHMQKIQPLLSEIQKKYKNDKEKLNEETMKLYKEYNVNPMGGCLPLLIQMPVLIAVYSVIQNPITYILKQAPSKEVLTILCDQLRAIKSPDTQLNVVAFVSSNIEKAKEAVLSIGSDFDVTKLFINFDFLGINLGLTPSIDKNNYTLLIIPVLGALTTFLSTKFTQKQTANQQSEQATQMQTMQMIFPFMTGYFCYILPAAMGLYWIIGNLLQIAQSLTLDKYILKKETSETLVIETKSKKK